MQQFNLQIKSILFASMKGDRDVRLVGGYWLRWVVAFHQMMIMIIIIVMAVA
jgi:hypothetical protein